MQCMTTGFAIAVQQQHNNTSKATMAMLLCSCFIKEAHTHTGTDIPVFDATIATLSASGLNQLCFRAAPQGIEAHGALSV